MMSEQMFPPAAVQRIIAKFITNEIVKHAEILSTFRAKFSDETMSRTQVYDLGLVT
jgi:hypothetical protein